MSSTATNPVAPKLPSSRGTERQERVCDGLDHVCGQRAAATTGWIGNGPSDSTTRSRSASSGRAELSRRHTTESTAHTSASPASSIAIDASCDPDQHSHPARVPGSSRPRIDHRPESDTGSLNATVPRRQLLERPLGVAGSARAPRRSTRVRRERAGRRRAVRPAPVAPRPRGAGTTGRTRTQGRRGRRRAGWARRAEARCSVCPPRGPPAPRCRATRAGRPSRRSRAGCRV